MIILSGRPLLFFLGGLFHFVLVLVLVIVLINLIFFLNAQIIRIIIRFILLGFCIKLRRKDQVSVILIWACVKGS